MRIAVFHNVPPGGARRVVFEEVKYLSKNHMVDVFVTDPVFPKVFSMKKFCGNVINTHFDIRNSYKGIFNRLISDLKVFISLDNVHKNIAKLINDGSYDVAIIHPDQYLETPYVLKYLKIPSVYFCHEPLRIAYDARFKFKEKVVFYKYFYELLIRFIKKNNDKNNIKYADQIVTESKFIKSAIKDYYKRESKLLYLGVDCNIFKPYDVKEDQLLFIGNRSKLEGYDLATQIIKLLKNKADFQLKVLDFNNGNAKITDDKRLAREYSKSFVTLCLDYGEPFGLKAIESMACGTPVLAVNEGGYKETVIEGLTGYLLPRNAKFFVKKILEIKDDYKKYNKVSKTCVRSVKENWTWFEHGRLLINSLKDTIRAKKYVYE